MVESSFRGHFFRILQGGTRKKDYDAVRAVCDAEKDAFKPRLDAAEALIAENAERFRMNLCPNILHSKRITSILLQRLPIINAADAI